MLAPPHASVSHAGRAVIHTAGQDLQGLGNLDCLRAHAVSITQRLVGMVLQHV